MSDESKSPQVSDRTMWLALQSFRPEHPVNSPVPLALLAYRIKATYQAQGQLDAINCIASRITRDWSPAAGAWVTRATRSPAAAYLRSLQGPQLAYPYDDTGVDLDAIAEWDEWCRGKGLEYNAWITDERPLRDQRAEICAAGRAAPRHDGRRWGLVIDRPASAPVDHLGPRVSRNWSWERHYVNAPDAFRVSFPDETDGWQTRERLIPWPGHTGPITVTEELPLPGKTHPDEIWREARRRQYETIHRPETAEITQDGHLRVAVRGDLVAVSQPTVRRVHMDVRVRRVEGALIELDQDVELPDTPMAIRWRRGGTEEAPLGVSTVRTIAERDGVVGALRATGDGPMPTAGDHLLIGPAGEETRMMRVLRVERGEEASQILHLVDAAPEIDTLTDAEVPPAWTGRVGSPIGSPTEAPAVPVIVGIETDEDGTSLVVSLRPGLGSAAIVGSYTVRHRRQGSTLWTTVTADATEGAARIAGYADGDTVILRARALSIYSVPGDETGEITAVVGEDVARVPGIGTLTAQRLTETWAIRWTLARPAGWTYAEVAGVEIAARAGAWTSYADLTVVSASPVPASPYLTDDMTAATGTVTWGVVAVATDGRRGEPMLVEASGTTGS